MKKKDDVIQTADQILQEAILREGRRIEELLGPETYQDPEGFDLEEDLQKLFREREALKTKITEYTKAEDLSAEDAASYIKSSVDVDAYTKSNEVEALYTKNSEVEALYSKNSVDEAKNNKAKHTNTAHQKNKKKNSKKKWTGTLAKAAAVVLVAGACLVGLSLRSEATRMWWMESFGWKFGDDSTTKVNNDAERELSDSPEWEAEAVIEKELGIQVPKFLYKPERCVFSDYTYETITNRATMSYKVEDSYLTVSMISGLQNYTSSINFDGIIQEEEVIASSYGDILVKEIYVEESDTNSCIAEWDYQDVHYEIFGRISFAEMKMMVKYIIF